MGFMVQDIPERGILLVLQHRQEGFFYDLKTLSHDSPPYFSKNNEAIILWPKQLQAHHGGHPSTSAGYIAATASFHGVPSFYCGTVKIILPPFPENVNLDDGKLGK